MNIYIYVLEGTWPPREFGVSSLGDGSKDDGLTVADDNTHVQWIGLHDSRWGDVCHLHQGVERR